MPQRERTTEFFEKGYFMGFLVRQTISDHLFFLGANPRPVIVDRPIVIPHSETKGHFIDMMNRIYRMNSLVDSNLALEEGML